MAEALATASEESKPMTTRRTFLGWLAGAVVSAVLPVAALLRCEPEGYEWLSYRAFDVADVAQWFNVPVERVRGLSCESAYR